MKQYDFTHRKDHRPINPQNGLLNRVRSWVVGVSQELRPATKKVYLHLCSNRADYNPSSRMIADQLGIGISTVELALHQLRQYRMIRSESWRCPIKGKRLSDYPNAKHHLTTIALWKIPDQAKFVREKFRTKVGQIESMIASEAVSFGVDRQNEWPYFFRANPVGGVSQKPRSKRVPRNHGKTSDPTKVGTSMNKEETEIQTTREIQNPLRIGNTKYKNGVTKGQAENSVQLFLMQVMARKKYGKYANGDQMSYRDPARTLVNALEAKIGLFRTVALTGFLENDETLIAMIRTANGGGIFSEVGAWLRQAQKKEFLEYFDAFKLSHEEPKISERAKSV